MPKKKPDRRTNPFLAVTWLDLEAWAGTKVLARGKSYQRSKAVQDLGMTADGDLVAWVEGSTTYATKVGFTRGRLSSSCTCPYGTDCKHGVAMVIEYLEALKHHQDVPLIQANDRRLKLIKKGVTTWPDEEEEFEDDEFEYEQEVPTKGKTRGKKDEIAGILKGKSREQLVDILAEIAAKNPAVKRDLAFKSRLSSNSVPTTVSTIRREIERASRDPMSFRVITAGTN